ncbi:hypothetical protein [Scytonema sp. NUACC21]
MSAILFRIINSTTILDWEPETSANNLVGCGRDKGYPDPTPAG